VGILPQLDTVALWQVNQKLIAFLSVDAPTPQEKLEMLLEIAKEWNVPVNDTALSEDMMIPGAGDDAPPSGGGGYATGPLPPAHHAPLAHATSGGSLPEIGPMVRPSDKILAKSVAPQEAKCATSNTHIQHSCIFVCSRVQLNAHSPSNSSFKFVKFASP
jgi:hypothetical protein